MAYTPGLSALIRQEIHSEVNKSFLRGLPAFRTNGDLPDRFRDLLARLDQAEFQKQ